MFVPELCFCHAVAALGAVRRRGQQGIAAVAHAFGNRSTAVQGRHRNRQVVGVSGSRDHPFFAMTRSDYDASLCNVNSSIVARLPSW